MLAEKITPAQGRPDRRQVEQEHYPDGLPVNHGDRVSEVGVAAENEDQQQEAGITLPARALPPQEGQQYQRPGTVSDEGQDGALQALGIKRLNRPPGQTPKGRAHQYGDYGHHRVVP